MGDEPIKDRTPDGFQVNFGKSLGFDTHYIKTKTVSGDFVVSYLYNVKEIISPKRSKQVHPIPIGKYELLYD